MLPATKLLIINLSEVIADYEVEPTSEHSNWYWSSMLEAFQIPVCQNGCQCQSTRSGFRYNWVAT